MPISELVLACIRPTEVAAAAAASALPGLPHRRAGGAANECAFPDNWIYVHTPGVRVGRVQNFGSWSPYLVKDGQTCLGLEYFVNEGDDLWDDARRRPCRAWPATSCGSWAWSEPDTIEAGYVVRMPKAYPVYDEGYARQRRACWAGGWPSTPRMCSRSGRNGMHKYNNQDHSMLTAMLAVENLNGAGHDLWSVNVEQEYHEGASTGRDAPTLPSRSG